MDVAKSEFPMKGFEEEYGRGRYFEKLDFKGLTLDFRRHCFCNPTNDGQPLKRTGESGFLGVKF